MSPGASLLPNPFTMISALVSYVARGFRPSVPPSAASAPAKAAPTCTDGLYTLTLKDGAVLSYRVRGAALLERGATPIVLICGMSALMLDYESLADALVKTHPVLLYDHRGMDQSKLTPGKDEDLSIELLATDLHELLTHLRWPEVALCGFSMGGVVAQQLLTLPFRETNPLPLPFYITHAFLVSTRCRVHANAGLKISPQSPNRPLTPEERKAIARRVVATLFDPKWVDDNPEKFEVLLRRSVDNLSKRPHELIAKQGAALQKFKFDHLLAQIPSSTRISVIHGKLDQVIPFHCGEEIVNTIPNASFAEVGPKPGQVPSLNFGHYWYHYFDIQAWCDVLHNFIETA